MIGLFDSGSGGVTILDTLVKRFPKEKFLYLGDHKNAPYGHRSNAQIVDLTEAAVARLMDEGCSLVILACNTAAAVALRTLQKSWLPHHYPDRRILGVLVPMVEAVTGVPWSVEEAPAHQHPARKVALFATKKTVESGAYAEEIRKRAPHLALTQKPCPGLVDAIEGGAGKRPLDGMIAGYVAETLEATGGAPDAAILGCTHFPLVKAAFEAALPPETEILSQPDIVAAALEAYLANHPEFRLNDAPILGERVTLWTTGDAETVNGLADYLPEGLRRFEHIPPPPRSFAVA